jgi:hypothetical protein
MIRLRDALDWMRCWVAMSRSGLCDEWGSQEYWRCRHEWISLGCPRPIACFIRIVANHIPGALCRENWQ